MTSEEIEIWKTLEVYPGYEISNLGRVKSTRKPTYGGGKIIILKPSLSLGYKGVHLFRKDIFSVHITIHRLVAIMFIPNPENKPHVNHKNGIKTDNRVENLEWATVKENANHAMDTGLRKSKRKAGLKRVSDEEVKSIRAEYAMGGTTQKALGKKYMLHQSYINVIVNHKNPTR